jgi:hypothetical protein
MASPLLFWVNDGTRTRLALFHRQWTRPFVLVHNCRMERGVQALLSVADLLGPTNRSCHQLYRSQEVAWTRTLTFFVHLGGLEPP